MSDQEKDILKLENEFLALSGSAFMDARAKVLASGQSVLEADGNAIYEFFPDGTRKWVKEIEPPTPVVPGTKITLW